MVYNIPEMRGNPHKPQILHGRVSFCVDNKKGGFSL
jgi:hypothetical protein